LLIEGIKEGEWNVMFVPTTNGSCGPAINSTVDFKSAKIITSVIYLDGQNTLSLEAVEETKKPEDGMASIRLAYAFPFSSNQPITFEINDQRGKSIYKIDSYENPGKLTFTNYISIQPGSVELFAPISEKNEHAKKPFYKFEAKAGQVDIIIKR